jgi:ribosomal protein S18 acetylase RimI-like enzyme
MLIRRYYLKSIDPGTLAQLRKLTLANGLMRIWIDSDLRRSQTIAFIAKIRNKIVGWAALGTAWNEQLLNIYVDPKYRKRGLGTKLLLAVGVYVKEHKLRNVITRWHTEAGKRLFEKNLGKFQYYVEPIYPVTTMVQKLPADSGMQAADR